MNTIRYSRREALHHHCFNKMTLYPRRYFVGFPIGFAFYVGRSKQWFSRAFVIDEAGEFWLACQYGDVRTDAQDDLYEKIVTASIHKKKCKEGVAILLKNFRIVEEREKYYICNYIDDTGKECRINVVKAYPQLKESVTKGI